MIYYGYLYCTCTGFLSVQKKKILQEKAVEASRPPSKKRKEKGGKNLSPRNRKAMPQHQRCPPEKRRGDKNPECHEEQQKDVA
jgi:hypothetical protein